MELFVPLVGVTFRGAEARQIVKALTPGKFPELSLEAEPDNGYDKNAVKVLWEDTHIGYLSRDNNAYIAEALSYGVEFSIEVTSFENTLKPFLLITTIDEVKAED